MRRAPHPWPLLATLLAALLIALSAPGADAQQDDFIPLPVIIESTADTIDPQPGEPTPEPPAPEVTPEPPTAEAPTATPEPTASGGEIPLPTAPGEDGVTPTPELPEPTPLPVEGVIFYDDFELDLSKWVATPDVLLIAGDDGNRAASLPGGASLQPFNLPGLADLTITAWFNLAAEGGLSVRFADGYSVTLTADAPIALTAPDGTPLADVEAESVVAGARWSLLEIAAQGGQITVLVDGVVQASATTPAPTSAGQVVFAATGAGAQLDDVSLVLPPVETIEPTETPSATPTPGEPVALEMDRAKLDGPLLNVLDVYATGDTGAAFGLAQATMLKTDARSRISVTIWAEVDFTGEQVAEQVRNQGGAVEVIEPRFVRARVAPEGLAALSLSRRVSVILVAERLSSADVPVSGVGLDVASSLYVNTIAGTIGNAGTEGFNMLGAQAWHQAGFTGDVLGTPITIGVIDVGFGGTENVSNNTDLTCLRSFPNVQLAFGTLAAGDSRRGRDMVEVICDIAPNADVRLYKAETTSQLATAIDRAASNNQVVVIGLDLGVNAAPGDGTLGYTAGLNPYAEILTAKQDGVIVIASAGNNGLGSVAFNYNGGSVSMQIEVAPGERVNLGWNDWDALPNGGGPREDFSATLSGSGFNQSKPGRGTSNPGYQFQINSCNAAGNGLCTMTLTLSGLSGAASLVQVQATGINSSISNLTGATAITDAGNIARPGDSPHAITVGAVCSNTNNNYPRLTYSSRGPVYAAGGNFTALPTPPFKGVQVKPDVVAPSQVSIRPAPVIPGPDEGYCQQGFGGSEAAAAHAAGMAALLLNNQELTQFVGGGAQEAMRNYMRTHAIDRHVPGTPDLGPDGYDMVYGAGLTTLGSPDFNPANLPSANSFIVPNRLPDGQTCAGFLYVGPYEVGSDLMDGTRTRPFTHPAYAIQVASQTPNTCVVLLPGEYVSPWYIAELANPVKVYGYSAVVRVSAPSSRFHVQNTYRDQVNFRNAGIYVQGTDGVVISGLTFTNGLVEALENPFNLPRAFIASDAQNVVFSNHRIADVFTRNTLVEVRDGSHGAEITGNTFRNIFSDESLFGSLVVHVIDSGTAGNPVEISENVFRDNTSVRGTWFIDGLPTGDGNDATMRWVSLLSTVDSYVDVVNNVFRGNQSETLIQIVTRFKGEDYVFGGPDQAPFVARLLGNVLVGNTMTTQDIIDQGGRPVGLNSGPLINLWHAQKTYIVNNTIARNTMDDTNNFGGLLIGRGNDNDIPNITALNGSLGSAWNAIEIVNNFVFDNRNVDGLFNDTALSTVGCRALVSEQESDGARFNWVFKGGLSGACFSSLNAPDNNNITALDPYPVDEQGNPTGGPTYIIGGADPTNPGFYVLTGGATQPDGVDEGANGFVQNNFADFFNGDDVRGSTRVRDGDTPPDGTATIDIGAYETTPLQVTNPIDVAPFAEDSGSGIITFEFNDFIEGGVPPFEFDITRYPRYFGTHCDARFTFAARGVLVETLDSGIIIASYCPPRDFHTQSTNPAFNLADVSFDVDVRDSTGSADDTTVNYEITQVNDTALTTSLATEAAVALTLGAAQNTVRLRPFVDFTDNFVFSERDTPTGTANREVDYDYTYNNGALPTRISGATELSDALSWVDQAQGIIGFNLVGLTEEKTATFQYTVRDRNNNQSTNTIFIRAVQQPSVFNLLTPSNNSAVVDTEALTSFTWEVSTPAQLYDLTLEREVDVNFFEPVTTLEALTPVTNDDDLDCTPNVCTLTVSDAVRVLLSKGTYRWNVEAKNQGLVRAAAEPFKFLVVGGRELAKNGGFEIAAKTATRAKDWRAVGNVTGDRRFCKDGVGVDSRCLYRFNAQKTAIGKIQQNARPIGAVGDTLTLSAYVRRAKMQAASFIEVRITYTNNKKAKIRLPIAKGNITAWTQFAKSLTLTGIVKKHVIVVQQGKGTGRLDVDRVSLILDQILTFRLASPADNAIFINPNALNTFTWDESGSAKTYDLTITNIDTDTDVIALTGLTRAKDTDRLNCARDLCRFTLESPLPEGRYEWNVAASTLLTAQNGPLRFDIDSTPTELLKNAGFEAAVQGKAKLPAQWKRVRVLNDARVCNVIPKGTKADTIRSYQGNCAFQFKGRPNAQVILEQNPAATNLLVDDVLSLTFVARATGLKANAGRVVVTVTYTDNTKATIKQILPPGTYPYSAFEGSLIIEKAVKSVRLQLIHSGASGGYFIDTVSLNRLGGN